MRRFFTIVFSILLLVLLASCELMLPTPKQGKMHIVVYGNDYRTRVRYGNGYVPELKGTVNDAVQMGNVMVALCDKGGIDYDATYLIGDQMTYGANKPIYGVPENGEKVRIISDLSMGSLQSVFYEVAADATVSDNDVFLFFYSGHGFYDLKQYVKVDYSERVSAYGSFCTSTNESANPQLEFYRFSQFLEDISQIKGKKVVIADCCYSGCLVDSDGFTVNLSLYPGTARGELGSVSLSKDLFILTASQYFNESQDLGRHGEFMALFLEALGWNEEEQRIEDIPILKNGLLTMDGIASYIRKCNNEYYYNERKQKVSVTGGSQDFILFDFR